MNLPSRTECLRVLKEYNTPQNIVRHSLAVNKAANYLAERFLAHKIPVNAELIDRGSLLHDVLRVCDIHGDIYFFMDEADKTEEKKKIYQKQREQYAGQHHAEATAGLFQDQYPELANVIRKHRLSAIVKGQLTTWEEKIVYYADKRVNHDKIVTLDGRMVEGKKRWHIKRNQEESDLIMNKMKELEKEIFQAINEDPNALH
ncbi:MAG: HDIG domain-containing metalloprotein [Patescibacteria group bacterium]|jgi:putative nucleotidyltransferase with HDIG domain